MCINYDIMGNDHLIKFHFTFLVDQNFLLNKANGEQVLRSTGFSLTIQIEEKLFDDLQKLWCSTQI
jgi:hypothetical protein